MEKFLFSDKEQVPTEALVFSRIGVSKTHWDTIFQHIRNDHPDFISEWRYYNDGKRWLLKTTRKSKTIFWLSVLEGAFKITFYFGDKAEPVILASSISDLLKNSFQSGKRYGKIRAITVQVETDSDVQDVRSLTEIKRSLK